MTRALVLAATLGLLGCGGELPPKGSCEDWRYVTYWRPNDLNGNYYVTSERICVVAEKAAP